MPEHGVLNVLHTAISITDRIQLNEEQNKNEIVERTEVLD